MSYSRSALGYMRHNFLKSMAPLFIPALLMGILLDPLSMLDIVVSIGRKENTYNSFIDIFKKLNDFTGIGRLFLILFALLITIVFVSVTSGYNRQRMRYGKDAKLTNIGEFLNDHFLPVAKYALFIFVSMEIVAILLSTFLYTAIKTLKNALPACIILSALFLLIELYLIALSLLSIPNMTMKGYGLFKSLAQSATSLSAKSFKLFFAILWLMALLMLPTVFIIIFPFENMKYVLKALSCLFYWVMISYMSVITYIVYFDVEELEREDLKL
ncbi:MAG: hypothetical protein K2N32_05435 [Clostridia bacterium]|nr:hypothetical protein [Clostridia bacterium]